MSHAATKDKVKIVVTNSSLMYATILKDFMLSVILKFSIVLVIYLKKVE